MRATTRRFAGPASSRVLLHLTQARAQALRGFSATTSTLQSKLVMVNPATEEEVVFGQPADTADSVASKYETARKAQPAWSDPQNLPKRIETIKKFLELLTKEESIKEGARRLTLDMGKPISQSTGEVKSTRNRVQFFLDNIQAVMKEEVVNNSPQLTEKITREPLGVIANIAPWNYPYFVSSNVFVPALLTGNTVLYKPSEFALRTGEFMTELLYQAGVPKEVFIPVWGAGDVGGHLLRQHIDGVFFTGSVATGQKINQAVAQKLIRVQLELGGKDATYVCEDVDIKAAAESLADGAMYNCGQSCCSVERIYVQAQIYEKFVENFLETVKGMQKNMGDPMKEGTYLGPLSRKAQLGVLESQVNDAVEKGARLLLGGRKADKKLFPKGFYFDPTVLTDVNHKMKVMTEESFGPIIGIQKVNSEEEAVRLMNDSNLGLTGGVYTRDPARARRILAQVHTGTVYWNCCDRVSPALPWSGRNLSGLGATLGVEGIRNFTVPKAWHLKQP
jgi:acyl-CoA reductase-like NAD-dependent aldehyde dehydrogenase